MAKGFRIERIDYTAYPERTISSTIAEFDNLTEALSRLDEIGNEFVKQEGVTGIRSGWKLSVFRDETEIYKYRIRYN